MLHIVNLLMNTYSNRLQVFLSHTYALISQSMRKSQVKKNKRQTAATTLFIFVFSLKDFKGGNTEVILQKEY